MLLQVGDSILLSGLPTENFILNRYYGIVLPNVQLYVTVSYDFLTKFCRFV